MGAVSSKEVRPSSLLCIDVSAANAIAVDVGNALFMHRIYAFSLFFIIIFIFVHWRVGFNVEFLSF